jgi:Carboxypeptidase regulatory-like domain
MHLQLDRSLRPRGTAVLAILFVTSVAPCCFGQTQASGVATGTLRGTVTDSSRSVVVGAIVTLQPAGSSSQRTTITDQAGLFHFPAVEPGHYALTITALGFTGHKANVSVVLGENQPLPPVALQVASAISEVDVHLPPHELAAAQVHAEERQRVLGVIPNFFVTYQPHAAPLTAAQKFQLGWKSIIDPVVLLGSGVTAGIEQGRNSYPEFGQGMEGYGKRFGAAYANRVSDVFIGHVVTQSIFRQDPRYFYKGTGTVRARALYAIATAFVRKGDNGRWQPDYSDVIGGLASGEISTLYYPASTRDGLRLFHNVLLGFGARAANHLMQEFVYRNLTTHVPKIRSEPILPEGTSLSLISIEDLRSGTPENARPINFVLAKDIEVNGVVVAYAGSKAIGEATYAAVPRASAASARTMHLSLENVHLKIGKRELPLRSTEKKRGDSTLEYHWLEDSGRIVLVLYLAQNVTFPPAE